MLDQKPYLIRAFYDWIVDSGCTPYLQIMVNYPGVVAPEGFDEEGVLVLNISNQATNQLQLGKDHITFWARFRGQPMAVHIPMAAVLAIFAKENAQGMGFAPPDEQEWQQAESEFALGSVASNHQTTAKKSKRDRGHLKVIK
jgi:stringent starvation protein B